MYIRWNSSVHTEAAAGNLPIRAGGRHIGRAPVEAWTNLAAKILNFTDWLRRRPFTAISDESMRLICSSDEGFDRRGRRKCRRKDCKAEAPAFDSKQGGEELSVEGCCPSLVPQLTHPFSEIRRIRKPSCLLHDVGLLFHVFSESIELDGILPVG